MTPDELFSIEFNAEADNSAKASTKASENMNMSLTANYNNGANKHENTVGNLSVATGSKSSKSNKTAVLGGLIVIAVPAALLAFRRKNNN